MRRCATWGWTLATFVLLGCGTSGAATQAAPQVPKAYSFTPSPLLELARSEREVPPVRHQWLRKRFADEPPEDTVVDEDGIVRTVRVHPFRLATPEELMRAALRHAESRRPRELHPTRFLIRTTGVRASTQRVRRRARRIADEHDKQTASCLVQEASDRTDVILRAPSSLVIEEAMRTGPLSYRLTVKFAGDDPPDVEASPPVNESTQRCLQEALTPGPGEHPRQARVILSAFSQRAHGHNTGGAGHQRLANEAATLGWIELERGAHQEALAYFEDAHWLYHRPEYELLQAMALQKMGRPHMALTRYRVFVEARPDAPETPMLRERIAALEAQRDRVPAVRRR